jgi:uncharacterized C2H2 Zn-finger protein
MIKITCRCHESFRISETNIFNKQSIICPNCEQEMPQDILELIKQYIDHINKANECLNRICEKTIIDKANLLGSGYTWAMSKE